MWVVGGAWERTSSYYYGNGGDERASLSGWVDGRVLGRGERTGRAAIHYQVPIVKHWVVQEYLIGR